MESRGGKRFRGDYLLGDCAIEMEGIDDQSIDMVMTSPPYDNLRDYGGYVFNFPHVAKQLERVLKQGGVIVWVVNDATVDASETGSSFKQALFFKDECGLKLHDTMIWQKTSSPFPETNRYHPEFEYMFVISKGKPKTANIIMDKPNLRHGEKVCQTQREADGKTYTSSGTRNQTKIKPYGSRTNVWKVLQVMSNIERTGHPAQFPEALARDHIRTWTNEGDMVLDPFMGSGTTGVACRQTNRDFIGIEINPEYLELARKRIEATGYQQSIFGT